MNQLVHNSPTLVVLSVMLCIAAGALIAWSIDALITLYAKNHNISTALLIAISIVIGTTIIAIAVGITHIILLLLTR